MGQVSQPGKQTMPGPAREGMLTGVACGPVLSQGHMGTSQLETELGGGGKTRWARAGRRKCDWQESVCARPKMGWQGASWGCDLSRGWLPWVEGCGGIGLADGKWGGQPSKPEDKN